MGLSRAARDRAQYVIGWRFHVWAVRSLQHGAANMYVLISLGTNAAYIYSVFAMIYYRVMLSAPWFHRRDRAVVRLVARQGGHVVLQWLVCALWLR